MAVEGESQVRVVTTSVTRDHGRLLGPEDRGVSIVYGLSLSRPAGRSFIAVDQRADVELPAEIFAHLRVFLDALDTYLNAQLGLGVPEADPLLQDMPGELTKSAEYDDDREL